MHNRNNILLIEDQLSLANDVISFLKHNNYNCFHASSLKKASSALRKNNFNTVLLDLGLPDGDGLSLIKKIKEKDPSCGVIIISAKDAVDKKVEGLELGADDYLTKPFFMPELNARIKSLIRRLNFEGNNEIIAGALKVVPDEMRLYVYKNELSEEQIEKILRQANKSYRLTSKILLSDESFDILKEYLEEKYPNNPFLKEIGFEILDFNKAAIFTKL